jgi:hypothetical protein
MTWRETKMSRMSKPELVKLIQSIEEEGGDTAYLAGLKALLTEVESDERKRSAGRPRGVVPPRGGLQASRDEEMTTQEYLEYKVGYLFPEGITGEVLEKLFEMDRDHNLKELKKMCAEEGLSTSGDKKILAAKLLSKLKRKREPVNANGAPTTGQERGELADSLDFHSDSPEQIEESIKRTGLRSLLDEAFRAAIERAKGSPRRKH